MPRFKLPWPVGTPEGLVFGGGTIGVWTDQALMCGNEPYLHASLISSRLWLGNHQPLQLQSDAVRQAHSRAPSEIPLALKWDTSC